MDSDSRLSADALRYAVKRFRDPAVGAVAGNVKVVNRHNIWTKLQRSEEHTSELQSRLHIVCRLLLEKKKARIPAKGKGDGLQDGFNTFLCHEPETTAIRTLSLHDALPISWTPIRVSARTRCGTR